MDRTNRILAVDDDAPFLRSLRRFLRVHDYEAVLAGTGKEALELLARRTFDLVLLDWSLPDRPGLDVLGELRSRGDPTPVIMLTAYHQTPRKVAAFDLGADDFMSKPPDSYELLARIRTRIEASQHPRVFVRVGGLSLDPLQSKARLGDRTLELTPTEFVLLLKLARAGGAVVERPSLEAEISSEAGLRRRGSLDNFISSLRRKLGDGEVMLETARGLGYTLRSKSESVS